MSVATHDKKDLFLFMFERVVWVFTTTGVGTRTFLCGGETHRRGLIIDEAVWRKGWRSEESVDGHCGHLETRGYALYTSLSAHDEDL